MAKHATLNHVQALSSGTAATHGAAPAAGSSHLVHTWICSNFSESNSVTLQLLADATPITAKVTLPPGARSVPVFFGESTPLVVGDAAALKVQAASSGTIVAESSVHGRTGALPVSAQIS